MPWESFTPPRARSVPRATITKRGRILLSRAAFEMIGSPETVDLLFDRTERTIGVKPGGRLKASMQGADHSVPSISAKVFCIHYGIAFDQKIEAVVEDGILVLKGARSS